MSHRVIEIPDYQKYSSSNVIIEINHTKNKRLKLYKIVLDFLCNGGRIEDFNLDTYNLSLNNNDKAHLKRLIEWLSLQPDIESTMRQYFRGYNNSLRDAIDSLISIFTSVSRSVS